jgi:hypothetical protein
MGSTFFYLAFPLWRGCAYLVTRRLDRRVHDTRSNGGFAGQAGE